MPHTNRASPARGEDGGHSAEPSSPAAAADDAVTAVLTAVGDPNRLRLLRALLGGERCVTQCMAATGLSQSSASKHLIRLIDAGLVERQRVGRRNYHRLLDPERVQTLLDAAVAATAATAK